MSTKLSHVATLLTAFYRNAGPIAVSPTMRRHVTPGGITALETGATADPYLRRQVTIIETQLDKLHRNVANGQAILDLKDAYLEATTYQRLKATYPATQAVPRAPKVHTKTPDFLLPLTDGPLYLEYKSLNATGGTSKQNVFLNDQLAANDALAAQRRAGKRLAIAETVIQPYHTDRMLYDAFSVRLVIETITNKISGNLHPKQFSMGDTLLLADLAELPLANDPHDALRHTFVDPGTRSLTSGELWHIAWGVPGTRIYKTAEFPGASHQDGMLTTSGILDAFKFVRGIVFLAGKHWYGIIDASTVRPSVARALRKITAEARTSRS